jgi:cbb3-type cytochrome oxidase subunit 3
MIEITAFTLFLVAVIFVAMGPKSKEKPSEEDQQPPHQENSPNSERGT